MSKGIDAHKRIGRNLRTFRELRGLKQGYLAGLLGITPNGYGKMERGESAISIDRLEMIARIYGVSVSVLLHLDTNQPTPTDNVAQTMLAQQDEAFRQELSGIRMEVLALQEKVLHHSKLLEQLLQQKR
jgi:transcriptional regulator with XRE-family HTH domain